MTAKALEPSAVIRLPMKALKEVFDENPDILVRVIQIIMIRLQRVIFTALRNYLGLYSELVQIKPHKDKRPTTIQIPHQKGSPTHHHKARPSFDTSYIHTLSVEQSDLNRPDMLNDLSEVSLLGYSSEKRLFHSTKISHVFSSPVKNIQDDFPL